MTFDKGFHVIRDPRDVIVSGYFSHKYTHSIGKWEQLKVHRENLLILDESKGMLKEIEFSSLFINQIKNWNYNDPRILEIKYEDIIRNPLGEFLKIFDYLDILIDYSNPAM